jgi:hypothetical protein
MAMQRRQLLGVVGGLGVALGVAATALADPSPNGPGQPGAPQTTCGNANTMVSPGNASTANGSPFNASGTAGAHYAGNPGTASAAHANSVHAVSQYDIACFQVSN